MRCFQLIKTVLDEIYIQIPGATEEEKDKAINECIVKLRDKYSKLAENVKIDFNYNDPTIRFAYLYKYVTSHANIVYQLIREHDPLAKLFDADKVNVSCIGGGPGSDFLGILKFILMNQKKLTLKCFLFDREQAWGDSWSDVDDKLAGLDFRVSTVFQTFDVTDRETWIPHNKYLKADLFTMIYFMSEVSALQKEATPFFEHLLQQAHPGAILLYVDNHGFSKWFDSLIKKYGLTVLSTQSVKMKLAGLWEEQKSDLGKYLSKFESPKLEADIDYRICIKP